MRRIGRRATVVYVFTAIFALLLGIYVYKYVTEAESWVSYPSNTHVYKDGKLQNAGTVYDRKGVKLVFTENGVRKYNDDLLIRKSTVHAVGDLSGNISDSVQSKYLSSLIGYNFLNGTYSPDGKGEDVTLTVDAKLSTVARKALGKRSGVVGVCNYKTGEIICMVSSPTFDPEDVDSISDSDKENGVFMNKFTQGLYAPGSVFKIVTTVAALENLNDVDGFSFTCEGKYEVRGEYVTCENVHGKQNLEQALANSCNCAYAHIATTLGRDIMQKTAEQLGFNSNFKMDNITCKQSLYNPQNLTDIDFAWSGIGQSTDMINPAHYLNMMSGIANGGTAKNCYFVDKLPLLDFNNVKGFFDSKTTKYMSRDTATKLGKMLRNNVVSNYGDGRFPGLTLCGKTGTAQIDKKKEAHSWFVGYSADQSKPYAFVVIVENGGFGITAAGEVASTVLQAADTVS